MVAQMAQLGLNRTGIATAKKRSAQMVEGTREFPPSRQGDGRAVARVREDYVHEAEPLGSMPPAPHTKRDAGREAGKVRPSPLLDKLGERLAFERTGVRLYEALLAKLDAYGSFEGGPERADIEAILADELEHFRTLQVAIDTLGGDATVVTPSADLHMTMTKGIFEVLVDPRTNFVQGLEAILLAELADNACWRALAELSEAAELDTLAEDCEEAETRERRHLRKVRAWIAAAQGRPAP